VEADACPGWCIDGSHRCPVRGFGDQHCCRVRPVAAKCLLRDTAGTRRCPWRDAAAILAPHLTRRELCDQLQRSPRSIDGVVGDPVHRESCRIGQASAQTMSLSSSHIPVCRPSGHHRVWLGPRRRARWRGTVQISWAERRARSVRESVGWRGLSRMGGVRRSRCACSRSVRSWARPRRPFTARSAPTRGRAPHTWGVPKEFADVIVTAMVALDTVSGDGAAVVEHKLQGRGPDEITGGWGHPGPRDQRGHGGPVTVYGARPGSAW
jgi:hypothetical protein